MNNTSSTLTNQDTDKTPGLQFPSPETSVFSENESITANFITDEKRSNIIINASGNKLKLDTKYEFSKISEFVAQQVLKALSNGTFAVGGALITNDGELIALCHNNVVENGAVKNPIGHVERQLSEWYKENREKYKLPEPDKLTIVSSLDPCCMCGGTIALTGFNVIAIARDKLAGVNYDNKLHDEKEMKLLSKSRDRFGYAGMTIEGQKFSKEYKGAYADKKESLIVSEEIFNICQNAFNKTVVAVKNKVQSQEVDINEFKPIDIKVQTQLQDIRERKLLELKPESKEPLNESKINSAALIDPDGNIIAIKVDENENSTTTAITELVREHSEKRLVGEKLPQIKNLRIVSFYGFDDSDKSLMELGVIGSSLEGGFAKQNTKPIVYLNSRENNEDGKGLSKILPPLYSYTEHNMCLQDKIYSHNDKDVKFEVKVLNTNKASEANSKHQVEFNIGNLSQDQISSHFASLGESNQNLLPQDRNTKKQETAIQLK